MDYLALRILKNSYQQFKSIELHNLLRNRSNLKIYERLF